jgi:outer membrane lipoprotein SlyB
MLILKKWLIKNKLSVIGAILGAIAGFLYWNFVGCSSGSCAITSSPINSTIYGAIMGALVVGIFKTDKTKNDV